MTIHKEGTASIVMAAVIVAVASLIANYFLMPVYGWIYLIILALLIICFLFIVSFFRIPERNMTYGDNKIIAPADGKVVVIEEAEDPEYFKGKRLQISIFMSPANVHVNRYPVDGDIVYNKYHKGKYLVAWHPKSSTDNERQSIVIKRPGKGEILVKQIAGALARRICNYAKVGEKAKQNEEMGFIKFGSRVDLLLPLGTKVNVELNQAVKGGVTLLATW
ncbi:phosphatidylserine decarboxylase family protein [Arachidicoccus ginsenosidivorans]|jgi:phosphatidylserine decarboxylase|uniref:Phosphatidylserine decarboxylase family protein n=1 Tax=Arachidicoccus ginsenosidivorans TaxID=496057 RepID=A0A5B8VKW3_9BACT|nr:phosphatidylserine decarboxylase family protein [Arachidicoccus ginsenosidivorans]QEC71833.1 phosphatidylserine decarboxylase family protein [Arachidicoccus ginsenosidivorans]